MQPQATRRLNRTSALLGLGAACVLGVTGCQVDVGGQTLPSPWYQKDDVQFFPAGPEFKLSKGTAVRTAFVLTIGVGVATRTRACSTTERRCWMLGFHDCTAVQATFLTTEKAQPIGERAWRRLFRSASV